MRYARITALRRTSVFHRFKPSAVECLEEFNERIDAIVDALPQQTSLERKAELERYAHTLLAGASWHEIPALHAYILRTSPPSLERAAFSRIIQ